MAHAPAAVNAITIPGFADPVRDSQAVFRTVLDAMAHPGRIVPLTATIEIPAPLTPATAAVCLTLLDSDTPVWLDPAAAAGTAPDYLRFHCGAPIVHEPGEARFAVIAGALPRLAEFPTGSDAYPDRSATLIVQVADLSAGGPIALRGPGIDGETRIGISPLPEDFTADWIENATLFPRGIDIVFTTGNAVCALPRTVRMEA